MAIGLLLVPIWGRIYCGWVCPVATTIDIFNFKRPLLYFKDTKKYFPGIIIQLAVVIASIVLLSVFIKTNFVIPFFIFLIPVGIILTFLFGEVFWHRHCFIGIMYSWLGKLSRYGYYLNRNSCSACEACIDICSGGCIDVDADGYGNIDKKHCLSCGKCKEVCPTGSIKYGSLKGK